MSMSQEEIESLMNGLDFDDQEESSTEETVEEAPAGNMSEDDINDLIAQTEDIVSSNDEDTEESVDELLSSLEEAEPENEDSNTNIDDILKELDEDTQENTEEENIEDIISEVEAAKEETVKDEPELENDDLTEPVSNDNIDDLLASIDGMEEDSEEPKEESTDISASFDSNDISDLNVDKEIEEIDDKINSGVFPLPAEDDTKVVNQLSQVANDSEEKATKIFDVLSNILDYNGDIQNDIKAISDFNEEQVAMLTSLSQKFPNIDAFNQNLTKAKEMSEYISNVNDKINDGNTEIFQAMELMQYHDINRQKIERVMSVIRKLSTYLNNLFEEDEGNREEVVVAKHIHGDNNDDLVGDDDLEALIAEFNN